MIRIAITAAAFRAIASTLPEDGPLRAAQQCLIHIEAAVLDRLRARPAPSLGCH
jgi:hypothetical protein